jgi:hypothetical protein
MKKHMLLVLTVSFFISLSMAGCAEKAPQVVTKIEYVKEKPWKFEKVDMEGAYILMDSKEQQRMCAPKMVEMGEKYREILDFYEEQMDEYKLQKGDGNGKK